MVVELAFSREELVLPPLEAEPTLMQVWIVKHEELFLPAFRELHTLGPRRAAEDGDGRIDEVDVLVDDGRVEVLTAAQHLPGGV